MLDLMYLFSSSSCFGKQVLWRKAKIGNFYQLSFPPAKFKNVPQRAFFNSLDHRSYFVLKNTI